MRPEPTKRIVELLFFCTWCLTTAGFGLVSAAEGEPAGELTVYVVNYPLKYFAERIAGEHATVEFPVPADQDPAYWMPDARLISEYQRADLVLLNGADYAKWVKERTLPRFRMVNTSAGFKNRYIQSTEVVSHSHGAEGKHAHEALAFTTWIDFHLAAKQAEAIAKAFSREKTGLRSTFESNYHMLARDLLQLDRKIKAIVSKNRSQPLVASHPVYDYFSHRYGLNIKSVHWEPGEIPTADQMAELQRVLQVHRARWMIWEGEPNPVTVKRLESMGINSLVFDPCGNVPDQGDFLSIMWKNVENLQKAFTNGG